jgi:hypothetical protein
MTKEETSIYNREYYIKNKSKIDEYLKQYHESNRDNRLQRMRLYVKENKEKRKEYLDKNKEVLAEKRKEYNRKNKDRRREYEKNRKATDPSFKLIKSLRRRQNSVLKGKQSTTDGLGCTKAELLVHISSQFEKGMTFDNHGWGEGKWHMDHKIPLKTYEKDEKGNWSINSEYNKKLIHYTNLQPMWHKPNLEKSDSIDDNELKIFLERVI